VEKVLNSLVALSCLVGWVPRDIQKHFFVFVWI
jgi:hypothetical protein